ncbi:MAG: T9SS type A sorting domain-containing protein [Saprospiraceae bacterium]|nr:T9SS type A sorting domain-containing protein [Saprospiraceae bacterium]
MKTKIPILLLMFFSLSGCIKDSIPFEVGVFSIYPNPAFAFFSISMSQDIPENTFYDINITNGREKKIIEILNTDSRELSFDMESQPEGIYYVNVLLDGKTYRQLVLISN